MRQPPHSPRLPRPVSPLGPALLAAAAGVLLTGLRSMRARARRRGRPEAGPVQPPSRPDDADRA